MKLDEFSSVCYASFRHLFPVLFRQIVRYPPQKNSENLLENPS